MSDKKFIVNLNTPFLDRVWRLGVLTEDIVDYRDYIHKLPENVLRSISTHTLNTYLTLVIDGKHKNVYIGDIISDTEGMPNLIYKYKYETVVRSLHHRCRPLYNHRFDNLSEHFDDTVKLLGNIFQNEELLEGIDIEDIKEKRFIEIQSGRKVWGDFEWDDCY